MGLLDKLWDDTLAGPRPESGLSRLRKLAPLSFRSNSCKGEMADGGIARDFGDDLPENTPRVTRSIMIKRHVGCPSPVSGTPPSSPAELTTPISPFSGARDWNRVRRHSSSDAQGGVGGGLAKTRSSPFDV